jgi:CheY-like chemotaxis protein
MDGATAVRLRSGLNISSISSLFGTKPAFSKPYNVRKKHILNHNRVMAKLVVISKSHAAVSHQLDGHWVTIGRAPGNSFQISEYSVSGQHCEVLLHGNELHVRDMRSTNGTYLKGRMITEGVLKMGEVMQLGEVQVRLEPSDPDVASLSIYGVGEKKESNGAVSVRPKANGTFGARKHQVLLVDDSMAFLEMAGEVFENFADGGWEIHKASAADQALSLVQQRSIEVAVLDINMPMLDGLQLLGMLHRRHPEVKKVILTASASEMNRTHCLASGAELFLEKPIERNGMRFVFNVLNDLMTWKQREGFAGTLQQVGLTDIIQVECLRRNSSVLEVHTPQARGEIYIESGVIVHAVTGKLSGEKALQRLLALNNGQFHLYPYREPAERTVQGPWEWLLMEAARLHDEERSTRPADKTVFVTRTDIEAEAAAEPLPERSQLEAPRDESNGSTQTPGEEVELPELGNGIVVVSTYDGKWKPAGGSGKP